MDLEQRVAALERDNHALQGLVWLAVNFLRMDDDLRSRAGEVSIVEMLEATILVRQTNDGVTSVPPNIQAAEEFALAVLAQARRPPPPEPTGRASPEALD